jgi:glycerate 2-kinase
MVTPEPSAAVHPSPWDRRRLALSIHRAAIEAMQPHRFMPGLLDCQGERLMIAGHCHQLRAAERVHLFSIGKAAVPMAQEALRVLAHRITGGVVVTPGGSQVKNLAPLTVIEASHPIPDHRSLEAGAVILRSMAALTDSDRFIALLSGGSSALVEVLLPTLTLDDLQDLTALLLRSHLPIQTVNTIRKHISAIKGGRLALATRAHGHVLVVSDVIGDDLTVIGSAPFFCDPTTYRDCRLAMEASCLWPSIPKRVRDLWHLGESGRLDDTPKQPPRHIDHVVVASNLDMLRHAQVHARELGICCHVLTPFLQGEAHQAAVFLIAIASSIQALHEPFAPPVCLLVGGETTVKVRGRGHGGRNQELALSALQQIRERSGILLLCAASDGVDGNSSAAGALVDSHVYASSAQQNLSISKYLADNDSCRFFEQTGTLLPFGMTGTNVMDLNVMIVDAATA